MIAFIFIAIIYGLVEMFKIFFKENFNNYIPFFALSIGIVFSLFTYVFEPSFIPVNNLISCLFFGFLCGLATIGWHQILKHLENEIRTRKTNLKKQKKQSQKHSIKKQALNQKQVVTLKDIEFNKQTQTVTTKPKEHPNIDLIENE